MKRRVLAILLLPACLAATSAWGQSSEARTVGAPTNGTTIDVEADLGLEPGLDPSTDNARVLSAGLHDSANVFPIVFPGKRFVYRQTVALPRGTAFRFQGMGKHRASGKNYRSRWAATLGPATRHIWQGLQVTFDGWTVKATADNAGDTIKLVGHEVSANDVGGTLWVVGGTNFVPNTYVITAANPEEGTWTVAGDGDIVTGAADGMIGYAGGTHWKDRAYGTWFDGGMNFAGHADKYLNDPDTTTKGAVAIHVDTNLKKILNTGKHNLRGGAISDYHVAFLFGRDLRELGHPDGAFAGEKDNSADTSLVDDWTIEGADYAFVFRNRQAAFHELRHIKVHNCRTGFYVERGGGITINGVDFTGLNRPTGNVTALRIGKIAINHGAVVMRDVKFDGSIGEDFKLLMMDESDGVDLGYLVTPVVFDNVFLPRIDYDTPIVDAAPGTILNFTNVYGLRPHSVRLRSDTRRGRNATAMFVGCSFNSVRNIEDVIHPDSAPGTVATFIGPVAAGTSKTYPSGRYVHGKGFTSFAAIFRQLERSPYRYAGADRFLRPRDGLASESLTPRYLHEGRTEWGIAP